MDEPSITYAQHPDATPESEQLALAAVYRFIIDCHARKEATRPGSPDDPERKSDEIRAEKRIL
jgi:hypothetical protein